MKLLWMLEKLLPLTVSDYILSVCSWIIFTHIYYYFYYLIFIVCDVPSNMVSTNKEELMLYFKQMYTMRRMEITNDTEYKVNYLIFQKMYLLLL